MTTKRKPMAPRLESASSSRLSAYLNTYLSTGKLVRGEEVVIEKRGSQVPLSRKDITRLRKFLEKCEAYWAAEKKAGRK